MPMQNQPIYLRLLRQVARLLRPALLAIATVCLLFFGFDLMVKADNLFSLAASHTATSDATQVDFGSALTPVEGHGDLLGQVPAPDRVLRAVVSDTIDLNPDSSWSSSDSSYTWELAWGDVDGDGDLDLAVADYNQPNKLYRNEGTQLTSEAAWSSSDSETTSSLAWGDVDGDGDLDLAVSNEYGPNKLYRNEGTDLTELPVWSSSESNQSFTLAWGDVDGDGDLDLAVGNNNQPNKLYRNEGTSLGPDPVWTSSDSDGTTSVAWGDVDGDGDLDLAVGNGGANKLYGNDGTGLTTEPVWTSSDTNTTASVAWGDVDGDGDLDLAVGNRSQPNKLYRNEGTGLNTEPAWISSDSNDTVSVAWGDVDGDGDLDLAVGNPNQQNKLYLNESPAGPGGVLDNLQLWLKADTGTSSSSDGSGVSSWSDQSPNGYTAADNNADAPTYQNEALDLLNFNPVLRFDGVDDGLDLGSDYIYSTNDGLTIFAVVRPASTTTRPRQFLFDFGAYDGTGYGLTYGSENLSMYTPTTHGGLLSNAHSHSHATRGALVSARIDFGTEQSIELDGLSLYAEAMTLSQLTSAEISASSTPGGSSGPVMIGRQSKSTDLNNDGGRLFSGDYAELMVYDNDLEEAQRQQVESYLALKYGITLEQSTAQDYTASDGTVIYTATSTLDGYDNDIAGIGRDDDLTFEQRKSKSINSGSIVTMDKGGAFTNDKDFVLWGHDGGAVTATTSSVPTGLSEWLVRKWAVQETGDAGAVTISVPTADLAALSTSGKLALIVADDAAFGSNVQTHVLTTNGANEEVSVTFDGTKYFTFGRLVPSSPGGISDNLQLWLKADTGTNSSSDGSGVTSWSDRSPNGYMAADNNADAPTYQNEALDLLNFNPVLRFDGVDDGLDLGSDYIYSTNDGLTIFTVVRPTSTTNRPRQFLLDFGAYDGTGYGLTYGSENLSMYTPTTHGGLLSNAHPHSHASRGALVSARIDFGTGQSLELDGLSVYSQTMTLSQLTSAEISASSTPGGSSGPVMIGRQSKLTDLNNDGGRLFSGDYAELIVYNNDLSEAQRQQVESYLALKYGITLDQSTAQDYTASDGAVIYPASSTLDGYDHNIAGIGRDDDSGLEQRKSTSINSDSIVTMEKGGGFANDKEFVVWGHDGATTRAATSAPPPGVAEWLARKWAIQKTGHPGAVTISAATAGLSDLSTSGELALIVADDAAFNSNVQAHGLTTNCGYSEVNRNLNDIKYFTFGRLVDSGGDRTTFDRSAPSGVGGTGLNPDPTWLSGDFNDTTSVAWGDVDGDGDLDLVVGNDGQANKLYHNEGTHLANEPLPFGDADQTRSVAWGDVDGDGDLDLAVGNDGQPNKLYRNEGTHLTNDPAWLSVDSDDTRSVAWGDVDGDGDLDLAVGNHAQPNKLYRNEGGQLANDPTWLPNDSDNTASVAWGDVDSDGDLDLAVGNSGQPNKLYLNEGGYLTNEPAWLGSDSDDTRSVAWGDVDGDGDLDLAVGNWGQQNKLYHNQQGLTNEPAWLGSSQDFTLSVVWGDVDGDGDLDLAVGNFDQPNKLYRNEEGLTSDPAWLSSDESLSSSLAWADVDGDGDLDLAVGDRSQSNKLYRNEGTHLTASSLPFGDSDNTRSVAWGDVDGDGDLDLAVGNDYGEPNKLYHNEGGRLTDEPLLFGNDSTFSMAWGDVDGDGDLDLAVGNRGGSDQLYRNEGGSLTNDPAWSPSDADNTNSVAWADVDGDGDLDLAVGHENGPKLYRNEEGHLTDLPVWLAGDSGKSDETQSVAWGDVDGDGDLDLAVANLYAANKLYRNDEGSLTSLPVWIGEGTEKQTVSVAWGDVDGDGDLDLAVGNQWAPNQLYHNEGGHLTNEPVWVPNNAYRSFGMGWGDVDGDGDLDPAIGNFGKPNQLYHNEGGELTNSPVSLESSDDSTQSVAWGDMDGDGDLDLAVGNLCGENKLYLNQSPAHPHHPGAAPASLALMASDAVETGGQTGSADFYAVSAIREDNVIPITYRLFHPGEEPMAKVRAFYSPDGGGRWLPALATTDTMTTNLATSAYPSATSANTHVFNWDVLASGFFGQSDNMVFRLEALPNQQPMANSIPGPFQRPLVSAQTYPFRVRGSQVQVLSGTLPVKDALVYRLPAGQLDGALSLANSVNGELFRTDHRGYLEGRGEIAIGDMLIALLPITTTDSYTVYHTSATPTESGLEGQMVEEPGVQQLVVSADNPLILFDLDLSLEWDARNDGFFLANLEEAIKNASDLLYDVSNGQVAIGEVRLHQAKENWLASNIVMYAANNIRPRANMGGIVRSSTHDDGLSGLILNAYLPGQVRMGPNWDPFGENHFDLGQDWWRALAHELAHYLLYLPDNYVGISQKGHLIALDCQGSFMTNTYDDEYSEFLSDAEWDGDCEKTIAAQTTGRSDWETISTFYPISDTGRNPGPSTRPLDVTQVTFVEPQSDTISTATLPARYFDLRDAQDSSLLPLPQAVGYLFKTRGTSDLTDDIVVALGATGANGDRIKVRGAEANDRICLFDSSSHHVGCETLTGSNVSVSLSDLPDWQPLILVTPVSSRTFAITVTQAIESGELNVQLLPAYGSSVSPTLISAPWEQMIPVDAAHPLTFTQVITLPYPAFEGSVRVWVPALDDDKSPQREAISQFYLSAAWGPRNRGVGGDIRPWEANARAWSGNTRAWGAPVASGDGQVTIFNTIDPFGETGTSALQALTTLPNLPAWLTPVGQGYQVSLLESATMTRTISFDYLQRDVPPGYEHTLNIYYLPQHGHSWQRLATDLDMHENQAATLMPLEAAGIYALLSTVDVDLPNAGWNLFSYPVQTTRPVSEALLSISDYYTSVYGYEGRDTTDPWKLYDVTVPDWVNDLDQLTYGRGYWINVSQPITLALPVDSGTPSARMSPPASPPATYYGIIEGEGQNEAHSVTQFQPQAGLPVTAWIGQTLCGQGETRTVEGQVVYAIDVWAEGQKTGCGAPGRLVSFQVGSQPMATTARWDNSQVWEQSLSSTYRLYMPLVGQ